MTKSTSPLSQFWIAGKLNGVDWYQLMSDVVPHLGTDQKESVLNIAGYKNINPLFIITHLAIEHQSSLANPSPDSSEIGDSVRKMTDLLHEQFLQTDDDNRESKIIPSMSFQISRTFLMEMMRSSRLTLNCMVNFFPVT